MVVTAPIDRDGFSVALFCALPLEAECMLALLDSVWDSSSYPSEGNDPNSYTLGAIGHHNVVIVHMHSMGTISSAGSAVHLQRSFPGINLALVVGICGGVPNGPDGNTEIILGDIIISSAIVQYDLGREYPKGFEVKRRVEDSLGRASHPTRALLSKLKVTQYHKELVAQTKIFLQDVQANIPSSRDPGLSHDRLFEPSYLHQHRVPAQQPACQQCMTGQSICQTAVNSSCDSLGCEESYLVKRNRLQNAHQSDLHTVSRPSVFFFSMASGNKVLKSAQERDRIAAELGVGAFEMEGAGVCEQLPSIVIKAVTDYADCHKSKQFQSYAAACAAACTKALLLQQPALHAPATLTELPTSNALLEQKEPNSSRSAIWSVPFSGLDKYVGRPTEIESLKSMLFEPDGPRCAAIVGPAGIGKTRLALEIASLARTRVPTTSVFWAQATDSSTLEQDFLAIGKSLRIPDIESERLNLRSRVHEKLRQPSTGDWLLILDNADDEALWARRGSLIEWLPQSERGSILVTTRTSRVAAQLTGHRHLIELLELSEVEAFALFQQQRVMDQVESQRTDITNLLERLSRYPLAIVQAAAYMRINGNTPAEYLELLENDPEEDVVELLDEEFKVNDRYPKAVSSVLATWTVSFDQIQRQNPLAAEYISVLCCLNNSDVPKTVLRPGKSLKQANDAIGTLKAYYLIREKDGRFSMHNLVYLATRNWLRTKGKLASQVQEVIVRLLDILKEITPAISVDTKHVWIDYLPHFQTLLTFDEGKASPKDWYRLLAHFGMCLVACGILKEGLSKLETVARWCERELGPDHESTWSAWYGLGTSLIDTGDIANAGSYIEAAYHKCLEAKGNEHSTTVWCMLRLSEVYRLQNRYEEAEDMIRHVIEVWKRIHGEHDVLTMDALRNLGYIYVMQSRHTEAATLLERVWRFMESSPLARAMDKMMIRNDLSVAYDELGRHDEAEAMATTVMEESGEMLGEEHPFTLMQMENVATIYYHQKRYREAEALILKTIDLLERHQGPKTMNTDDARAVLADIKRAKVEEISGDVSAEERMADSFEDLGMNDSHLDVNIKQ